jgi:Outer membrane protein beta-barrel domain
MRLCLWSGLLLFLVPSLAAAQAFETHESFWEVTAQPGFFVPEEPEGAEIEARELLQLRVGYRRAAGFGVEAYGAYTPLEFEAVGTPPESFDMPTFLYGGDVVYAWSISPRADFFVSAGLGGITWTLDREDGDDRSETNLRLPFGAGFHWLLAQNLAFRADLKDHIIFDQLADIARDLALVDRGNTNNLEGSIGLSLVLP